ncbi:S24 family peptidase [Undibacterium sp. Ji83W]|uniref:S24 family peptidase n=1 Tax=Undibacterium sp. Ji83W TaxID=3413043 RepID=UPI003BF1FD72
MCRNKENQARSQIAFGREQKIDGLRIKQLRREIDGTWVLESRNPDKRTYPDERITPENVGLLKIIGRFVYRQGG